MYYKKQLIYVLFITIIFSGLGLTQNQLPPSDVPNPSIIYRNNIHENNYLKAFIELQKDEFAKSEMWSGMMPDLLAYLYSFMGDYQKAYAQLDRAREKYLSSPFYQDVKKSPIDEYEPKNAIDDVSTLADSHPIIMINEEHDTPMHRAFTTRLLPVLYAKGFRYLAAETFTETNEEIKKRGYPSHKTGFYTNDPVFGEMVRTASRLGFTLVPYEHPVEKVIECSKQQKSADECQNERERGQAQNLYDRILKNDPKAKVLVHVGRGHNQQLNNKTWAQMGWHFKVITGITPLSVNQMLSERSEPKYETGLYRYVTSKWNLTEPTVFKNKDKKYYSSFGYNLDIFHPRATYENGRPTWLKLSGDRKAERINLKKLKVKSDKGIITGNEPVLIQALRIGEGSDTIPVDQIILYPNQKVPVLILPKGKFRIRAMDKSGKEIGQYQH